MITLAKKLGTPEHHSLLLRRAKEVGLHGTAELIGLAIARGCRHYGGGSEPMPTEPPSRETFSDEELAVALLSPCLAYSPRALRVGAQMMGSRRNRPGVLPHPSRFRSETGLTNPFSSAMGDRQQATWLRPSSAVSA